VSVPWSLLADSKIFGFINDLKITHTREPSKILFPLTSILSGKQLSVTTGTNLDFVIKTRDRGSVRFWFASPDFQYSATPRCSSSTANNNRDS
jgi:hypothetical protein